MTFTKDPTAVRPYGLDWSEWIEEGDYITASVAVVTIPEGATVEKGAEGDGFDATATWVWLTGGNTGDRVKLAFTITTHLGYTDTRYEWVEVMPRSA